MRAPLEDEDAAPSEPAAPAELPLWNEDGVDLTQLRASLARTPLERLRENEDGVRLLALLERARRPR